MIRLLLWGLLLFLLPFAVAYFWLALVKKIQPSAADLKVWALSACVGLLLVLGSLFVLRAMSGVSPANDYVPPKIENGTLQPGYFKSKPAD